MPTPTATTPDWYDDYLYNLAAVGDQLSQEDYQPYGGPRIADFTPDQEAGFAAMRDTIGTWQPYADTASQQLQGAQSGLESMRSLTQGNASFDPAAYESMYNTVYAPSVQSLQDEATRVGNRNFQDTTLAALNSNFAGSGQFGSGRHQILGQDAAARAQAEIEGLKAGVESQGRQAAAGDYMNWAKQGMNAGNQMGTFAGNQSRLATDMMNFGSNMQNLGQRDATTQMGIGEQEQQMNQQNYNMAYNDFQTQQNFPWQQLQRQSQVLNNQAPSMSTPAAATQVTAPNPWTSGLYGGLGAFNTMTSMFR